MSRIFNSTVAVGALMAMLAGPTFAQEAGQAPAEGASIVVPQALLDAGLTDVESKSSRRGNRVEGKLPDGTEIDAILDGQGQLMGLRADGDGMLPAALVASLVPQPIRDQAIFAELTSVEAVFNSERGIMIAGQDAQKNQVRAAFAEDGTLLRFGRGEDAGRGMGPGPEHGKGPGKHARGNEDRGGDRDGGRDAGRANDRGGDRDHDRGGDRADKRGDKDHGPRGDGPREGRGDDRRDWREGGGDDRRDEWRGDRRDESRGEPRGERRDDRRPDDRRDDRRSDAPRQQGTPPAPAEIRSSLTEAGYTAIGQILQQGPVTVAQATNPEGEPVLVEIGTDGRVLRELNR